MFQLGLIATQETTGDLWLEAFSRDRDACRDRARLTREDGRDLVTHVPTFGGVPRPDACERSSITVTPRCELDGQVEN